jgi:DegV family protein with EDD domain
MNEFALTCCSTADQTREFFEARDIRVIFFHCLMEDGKSYPDDLGQTIPYDEFYQKMRDGALPTTSQPNVQEFIDFFEPMLKEGKDILHISTSTGITGEYNSACIAAETLREKYSGRKLLVVDSLTAACGYGLIMDRLSSMRAEGKTIDECCTWITENRKHVVLWLFSTDLTWYVRGGRVSAAAGFVGNVLNICPFVYFDDQGHLIPHTKVRTKARAIVQLEKIMERLAYNGTDYDGTCFISVSGCYPDGRKVADLIEQNFPKLKEPVHISSIGSVIGAHTGPGTVGLAFMGELRIEKQ